MADSGTVDFEVVDGAVKITGKVCWAKSGNNATFYAKLTKAYSKSNYQSQFIGNEAEAMRLYVDNDTDGATAYVSVAGRRYGGASKANEYIENNDYAGAQTATLTKAKKNTAYLVTIQIKGNGGKTWTTSITVPFNIPLFVNPAGTVYQAEKAFANIPGVGVKEVTVYANVGGEIKEFT